MIPIDPITAFARQWGAPILAGLLALGLGLGFWLFINDAVNDRKEAETRAAELATELDAARAAQISDARQIGELTGRLAGENALADGRLEAERAQRLSAEKRAAATTGDLNDLRQNLGTQPCGIGTVLYDRLLDSRAEREADRIARDAAD